MGVCPRLTLKRKRTEGDEDDDVDMEEGDNKSSFRVFRATHYLLYLRIHPDSKSKCSATHWHPNFPPAHRPHLCICHPF
jgi:hypothetical protein